MAIPNPQDEHLIAEWEEPATHLFTGSRFSARSIITAALLTALVLLGLGLWQKDPTLYLAALVALMVALAIKMQSRSKGRQLKITLTNYQLVIGKKSYPLTELAGFWLQPEHDLTVVNFEMKKVSLVPLTVLHPSTELSTVTEQLLAVLPEVEPRQSSFTDRFNHYLRF